MPRIGLITAVVSVGLLVACDGRSVESFQRGEAQAEASAVPPTDANVESAGGVAGQPSVIADPSVAAGSPETAVAAVSVPQLAYSYSYALSLPNRSVRSLAAAHEQACANAGPQKCQIIGSETHQAGNDQQQVTLELRASPEWLTPFRAHLADQAEAAGGEVLSSSTQSEDLTRAIIDTEAHLRAKTTLRDRLQTMLATRDGNLQSVLEVERELARVQGEIDSATSTLQAMRARVAMSQLTLTYQSEGVLAPDSATAPLQMALNGALGLFMWGAAAIVSVLAFALPFGLVLGPIIWLVMMGRHRRKQRTARTTAASVSTDPLHPE